MTNHYYRPAVARQRAAVQQAIANRNGRPTPDPDFVRNMRTRLEAKRNTTMPPTSAICECKAYPGPHSPYASNCEGWMLYRELVGRYGIDLETAVEWATDYGTWQPAMKAYIEGTADEPTLSLAERNR